MRKFIFNKYSACLLIIIIATAGYIFYCLNAPLTLSQESASIEVVRGDNISSVARQLHERGVLQHPNVLVLATYISGKAAAIRAGEYLLDDGMTPIQLLKKLIRGDVVKRQVTFIEGWTFEQMQQEIKKHNGIEIMLGNSGFQTIMTAMGLPNLNPEGQFFPDTYRYEKGTSDIVIFRKAYELMQSTLASEWSQRDTNLPYQTPYEALIMASIIEKETGTPEERARIAAVFINRLKMKMPLQTDPTVIYGLGNTYKGNLTKAHLLKDGPYNTYTRVGLPPTPIANPSKQAIHAALHPAPEKVLYFVGKGDGTHYFSETLAEHNRAVRQYQLDRKIDNYHSSPTEH